MAKSKVAQQPAVDPTLPKIELELAGEKRYLVFTFGALALAEAKLREVGVSANLLHALDLSSLDASKVVPLLYAALITHDPEITPVAVAQMVTFRNLPAILTALYEAYSASTAEADPGAPKAGAGPLDQAK